MTTTATEYTPGIGFTEATVEVQDFTIRYFEKGEGEPLVVLHGAGGPQFTVALDLLAERHRVLLLVMPGFGGEPNTVHQTLSDMAETVAEAVAALAVERYHLLGTSFGGATALHLALAHPERLLSLVLDAPAAFREGATTLSALSADAASPADLPAEEMARRFRVFPERVPAYAPTDPALMVHSWPVVERLLARTPAYDHALADRLPACTVRTLVVFGDRDGIVPPENGRTYRRLLPNCTFQLVHQAAHSIQGDRPEAFADVVGDFLARGWQFLLPETSALINP